MFTLVDNNRKNIFFGFWDATRNLLEAKKKKINVCNTKIATLLSKIN